MTHVIFFVSRCSYVKPSRTLIQVRRCISITLVSAVKENSVMTLTLEPPKTWKPVYSLEKYIHRRRRKLDLKHVQDPTCRLRFRTRLISQLDHIVAFPLRPLMKRAMITRSQIPPPILRIAVNPISQVTRSNWSLLVRPRKTKRKHPVSWITIPETMLRIKESSLVFKIFALISMHLNNEANNSKPPFYQKGPSQRKQTASSVSLFSS